jgi:uncharacterized protein
MEVAGYIASVFIGVSLGLIGGGGSILTVPVMVYFFGVQPLLATSYSLFIVGATSLVGAYTYFEKGLIHMKAALLFGVSSVITVFVTRRFIVPSLPENIFHLGRYTVTGSMLTMMLFAVLMLLASISMIRDKKHADEPKECNDCVRVLKLTGYGVAIGLITGFLGAGGGFFLIPALVFLLRLPIRKAIGTSLLIIALNSLVGFTGDLGHFNINWFFLLKISGIAVAGMFIGKFIGGKISAVNLKKAFGWFVLSMGVYIIFKETIF